MAYAQLAAPGGTVSSSFNLVDSQHFWEFAEAIGAVC